MWYYHHCLGTRKTIKEKKNCLGGIYRLEGKAVEAFSFGVFQIYFV